MSVVSSCPGIVLGSSRDHAAFAEAGIPLAVASVINMESKLFAASTFSRVRLVSVLPSVVSIADAILHSRCWWGN